ncbi:iron complex outermembrane receptor protein [Comamonas sp. BIGb0152]|uniref:TonB-dependent siderophore receptor n=1 Tax=Comamonas sp. BIGb0152 TaxID=2940601 RepID=UPI0021677A89|nr:TonB-dependent siderophore receptor [Comamonas sp. BIGb0152]MCS4293500.1 iron complex outermembrane receptor protein [Comamonas sp. BIGb0152]
MSDTLIPAAAPRALHTALHTALWAALACWGGNALAQDTQPVTTAPAETTLAPITVQGDTEAESATGPVKGFVAKRAISATKTDTPLIETPQAISVVTRDQLDAQGVTTLRETTRYTAGINSSYFDNRVDSFKARGGDVSQYQDGLLRTYGTYNNIKVEPYTLERVEFLRGPSSVLYGQGSVGGVLNLTSKRPLDQPQREVQLQLGSHSRKQIASDITGPIDEDGRWLYRLVAVGRDSNTQVDHVKDDRLVIAPSLTFKPFAGTSLTLQAMYHKDKSGSITQFFPWQGTRLPSAYGQIPTNTFISEPNFDKYDSENKSFGYLFSHQLNDSWTLRQNLRRTSSEVDYRTLYTSFAANAAAGRPARPVFDADGRTVQRDAVWQVNGGRMLLVDTQLEGKLQTGDVQHTVLAGMDWQRNTTSQASWRALGTPLDVYNPVYGSFTPPTASQLVQAPNVAQRQLGFYLQDQLRWGDWTATAGLRRDHAKTETEGRPAAAADDSAWTKRLGVTYQAGGGWAPYLSYTESFQPLGGVDFYGTPYKPQRGKQVEAGVKWIPEGRGISGYAAVYSLREENRKTNDPANPLNSLQLGEVKTQGFEAEMTASLAKSWDWTVAYAYTDAKISRSNAGDQGQRVTAVSRHMASSWLMHRFASQGRGGWSVGAGMRYSGPQWTGTTAIDTPSSLLTDAMVAYDSGDWRLAFHANNLTDKVVITQCLSRGDCFYGERRNFLLTATYRY